MATLWPHSTVGVPVRALSVSPAHSSLPPEMVFLFPASRGPCLDSGPLPWPVILLYFSWFCITMTKYPIYSKEKFVLNHSFGSLASWGVGHLLLYL